MRLSILRAIYQKEMLDLIRDRRTLISMVVVPVLVIPLLANVSTRLISRMQENAESEAKSMAVAIHIQTPALREALERAQIQLVEKDDLKDAILKKSASAGVDEIAGSPPGSPTAIEVYSDNSSPTSAAAATRVRAALDEYKLQKVRESLENSNIPESVLTPFVVKKINVAEPRKMSGMVWGSMLGYVLLVLMFAGGMYPIIDMTAGEKERKTIEALLASPASRLEIVLGKNLAAVTAIFITAILTLGSMIYTLKGSKLSAKSPEVEEMLKTIPLDPHTVLLIAATLIPLSIFAASLMFSIALFARSYKEGQSYLTPLVFVVIFPALMGGLSGFHMTPALCLIPIFNVSQMIRGIMLGDVSTTDFAITTAANLVYAAIAFAIATRQFQNESVLFRS